MVGGTVIEACDHPKVRNKIYVNVAQRPYSKIEEVDAIGESTQWGRGHA